MAERYRHVMQWRITASDDEAFQLLLSTLIDIMMSVLLPLLPSFSKGVTQLTEKEVKVLICSGESLLELLIQRFDLVLLRSILNEVVEELEILASVFQVRLTIHLPAPFQMTWYDLGGVQRRD